MVLPVTVRDLLELNVLQDKMRLVAGSAGLDRVISLITIQEAPDFYEWVTGGEVVLTTWYAFSLNPELQANAFIGLAQQVAAVGIKTGRFIEQIPEEIMRIADEQGLPLFIINREAKFRDIIQAISAEINNEQTNLLIEVDKHYQDLVKVALAGGDEAAMLQGMGKRSKMHCFFIDMNFELLATYFAPHTDRRMMDSMLDLTRSAVNSSTGTEIVAYYQVGELHIFPCTARRMRLGYLVLVSAMKLPEKVMFMANQLATFLTLKLVERLDIEQKGLTALLDAILYRHNLSEEQLQERLLLFGLKGKVEFRTVVLQSLDGGKQSLAEITSLGYHIKGLLQDALLVIKPDEIVILAAKQGVDSAKPPAWVKITRELIKEKKGLAVGVGPVVEEAAQLEISYRLAKRSIQSASMLDGFGVFYYRDYLARMVVLRGMDSPECQYLVQQVIEPLREYDAKYRSELISTLQVAMFAQDMDEVSKVLHIHSNTVRYRLNKVTSVTGYDFFSPLGRYVLTTAFFAAASE